MSEAKEITLTVREIYDLARAAGFKIEKPAPIDEDDMESEYTIFEKENGVQVNDDDGTPRFYRHGAYLEEYPEEGTFPLGTEITNEGETHP